MPVFLHPEALFLLLLIPGLYLLRRTGVFKQPAFPLILSDWGGDSFSWKQPLLRCASVLSSGLFTVGFLCLVVALGDPVFIKQERVYTSRGTDILFVIDTSPSMMARDIAGMSRLEAAKQAVHLLVPDADGSGFGLVALASEAALTVPPTTDRDAFFSQLDGLTPGTLGDGTALGAGLTTAAYHLAASAAPKKCIVLITDGENNAGAVHPATAARLAAENGITIYVLGIGTSGSVPIEYVDPVSGKVYTGYLDSHFDTSGLEEIAEIGGGQYFGVETAADLSAALSVAASREQTVQTFYMKSTKESCYDTILLVGVICFAAAWIFRRLYLGELF